MSAASDKWGTTSRVNATVSSIRRVGSDFER
jgi:hypothetical protein